MTSSASLPRRRRAGALAALTALAALALVASGLAGCGPSGRGPDDPPAARACLTDLHVETSGGVGRPKLSSADEERSWTLPQGLRLSVSATREPDGLRFLARVKTDTGAPADWVYLTGGEPGTTNPVHVRIATAKPRPAPARPRREAYPEPERVRLEPGAEIRYLVHVCASDYEPPWPRKMKVEWSVEAWGASRVTGEISLE